MKKPDKTTDFNQSTRTREEAEKSYAYNYQSHTKLKDGTRQLAYIEDDEDLLQKAVEWAVKHTMDELFAIYCDHITSLYAMAGIDVKNYPIARTIYYIEDGQQYK